MAVILFVVCEKQFKSTSSSDNKCLNKNKIIKDGSYFFEMSDAELKKFQEKFKLIKIGMLENRVVQLMGKPSRRMLTKNVSFFTFKRSNLPPPKLQLLYYTKRYKRNGSNTGKDKSLLFCFRKDQSGIYKLTLILNEKGDRLK